MRPLLAVVACTLAVSLCACSREPQPKVQTPADIQAQIDKVQNDPKMPQNIKGMVLGNLQHQKTVAEKRAAGSK